MGGLELGGEGGHNYVGRRSVSYTEKEKADSTYSPSKKWWLKRSTRRGGRPYAQGKAEVRFVWEDPSGEKEKGGGEVGSAAHIAWSLESLREGG